MPIAKFAVSSDPLARYNGRRFPLRDPLAKWGPVAAICQSLGAGDIPERDLRGLPCPDTLTLACPVALSRGPFMGTIPPDETGGLQPSRLVNIARIPQRRK